MVWPIPFLINMFTALKGSQFIFISTGDGMVDYGAVYLNWDRCGRVWHCKSLLGKVW